MSSYLARKRGGSIGGEAEEDEKRRAAVNCKNVERSSKTKLLLLCSFLLSIFCRCLPPSLHIASVLLYLLILCSLGHSTFLCFLSSFLPLRYFSCPQVLAFVSLFFTSFASFLYFLQLFSVPPCQSSWRTFSLKLIHKGGASLPTHTQFLVHFLRDIGDSFSFRRMGLWQFLLFHFAFNVCCCTDSDVWGYFYKFDSLKEMFFKLEDNWSSSTALKSITKNSGTEWLVFLNF